MAWCPKCKNEYREGITICVDCDTPLVDDLESLNDDEQQFEALFVTKHIELAEKFTSYLEYSDLHRFVINSDEDNEEYTVRIHPDDYDTARKLYRGFAITESVNAASGACSDSENADDMMNNDNNPDSIDEPEEFEPEFNESISPDDLIQELNADDDITEEASGTYIRKSERYNEYRSSAYTCILVGVLGIIFGILNITEVFSFISSIFSQAVMMTMFALFFIGGIYMYISSNKIRSEIDSEAAIENKVTTWLTINVTPSYLDSIKDENLEDEINYFNYCNAIRKSIADDIPEAPASMVDALIDEHLSGMA